MYRENGPASASPNKKVTAVRKKLQLKEEVDAYEHIDNLTKVTEDAVLAKPMQKVKPNPVSRKPKRVVIVQESVEESKVSVALRVPTEERQYGLRDRERVKNLKIF